MNTSFNMIIFLSDDIKVSVNDFIIKAAAITLQVSGKPQIILASKIVSYLRNFIILLLKCPI
jgi:hypothetical protein